MMNIENTENMENPVKIRKEMEKLRESCKCMGVFLTDEQLDLFCDFYIRLIEKNKVMNLTAITQLDEVIEKHFLDSLSLINAYEQNEDHNVDISLDKNKGDHITFIPNAKGKPARILDIGTGAGFPGIPLRIGFPDNEYVLADSLNKRLKFIQEYIDNNRLNNITTVHGRAEDLARKTEYREQFDVCVSRAVANLSSLCEYCLPYVRKGGVFISYKAGNADEEIEKGAHAIAMLGGKCEKLVRFTLPGTDLERILVVIRKEKNTPSRYPRKAGVPSKEPL